MKSLEQCLAQIQTRYTKMLELQFHPYAELFPEISKKAMMELEDDILQNGVHEPIWLFEGKILDGRNRYKAANRTGTRCPTRDYEGDNPLAFVLSLNLHRRHLSESQRSMVAGKISTLSIGSNQHVQHCTPSREEAAEMLNVSPRSVSKAKKVIENAIPEVSQAVTDGKLSVNCAAKVSDKPKKEQKKIITGTKKEILAAVSEPDETELTYTKEDALQDEIAIVRAEYEHGQNQLAAMVFEGSKEEKSALLSRLDILTKENSDLSERLRAMTRSRDDLMIKVSSLTKENIRMSATLKKLHKNKDEK